MAVAADHLEVRPWGAGFGVWDKLTGTYVSPQKRSRHYLTVALEERRKQYRPLVVRWMYGLPTAESRRLGVT